MPNSVFSSPIQTGFFQVDLVGLIGLILAISGLILSIINYISNLPSIKIYDACLSIPGRTFKAYKEGATIFNKSYKRYLDFNVEIYFRNSRSGHGSITKPTLVIGSNEREIKIKPKIKRIESETSDTGSGSTLTTYQTIREGAAYNVSPGGQGDDQVEYEISDLEQYNDNDEIDLILRSIDNLKFKLEYTDNKGKKIHWNITRIRDDLV